MPFTALMAFLAIMSFIALMSFVTTPTQRQPNLNVDGDWTRK